MTIKEKESLEIIQNYHAKHNAQINSLHSFGFESIGCESCTTSGKNRERRWLGYEKIECGLHL